MIGSLANMVVLVAYGNALLKSGYASQSFDQHVAFKFYEWIRFRQVKEDVVFAGSPTDYMGSLDIRGVRGLMLTYGANTSAPDGISEHMSAGFVGGGKQYLIQEFTDTSVNYLALQSELGDRERTDQRIWRDTFQLYATVPRQIVKPDRPDLEWAAKKLADALQAAIRFCDEGEPWLKTSNWPDVFRAALNVLDDRAPPDFTPYLDFPQQVMSAEQNRLLQAADRAWVFGGMGSWNDMGFENDQRHMEYETVSSRLYQAVNVAIADATNSASPAFDLAAVTTPLPSPFGGRSWWKFW